MSDNATHSARPIRDMRLAAGLSQEALAREVNCSTAYVRVLERGYEPDPSSAVYRRLHTYLSNAAPRGRE